MGHKVTSSQKIYTGDIITLRRDQVSYSDGYAGTREVIEHPGAVGVIGLTEDGLIPLVSQYRHATGGRILEIPAGLIDPGESNEECAVRELREEVGGIASQLDYLGWFYTTPGYSSERFHLFFGSDLTMGEADPEDGEDLELELVTLAQGMRMVEEGSITDSKTIIGLLRLALLKGGSA